MRSIRLTRSFEKDYRKLPSEIQCQCDETLQQLIADPRYPSLRLKKMEGFRNIWEARVSYHYRLTLTIDGEVYIVRRVGTHSIFKNP